MENNSNSKSGYTDLVKNTAIFTIGSFGSKVLTFLIVPLYTYVLSTEEYGRIDLFSTTISLILPLITLLMQEALLRFLMGKEISKKTALNNCFFVFFSGAIVSVLLCPAFNLVFNFDNYLWLFVIILILNSFTRIFSQYLRAIGKNVAFAINGILVTVVLLSSNVVLLIVLKCGMVGYFYSMLLSQLVSAVYIIFAGNIVPELSLKGIDFRALREMLKFSIPLIPDTLMWWIMSAGDKYIINYSMGDAANGLYSLAMKVPTIISLIFTNFYQAWQMSAIESRNNGDEKHFYSKVFTLTNGFMSVLIVCVITFIKPVFLTVMSESFASSWEYVPLLSIAIFFSCLAAFFGVVYTVTKKSKMSLYTSAVGAAVNIFFNVLLVGQFGLYGIAAGTALGYVAVLLMRIRDAKREIGMSFDVARTCLMVLTIVVQAVCTTVFQGAETYLFGLAAFVIVTVLYRKEILEILENLKKKLCK
jgi:O-antigen/teichoic acid export membrane protein